MTNSIYPVSPTPLPPDAPAAIPGTPAKATTSDANLSAPPPGEAVTLSAAAQTSTQLLSAARDATGINQAAVAQIRAAIANGTYNVSPENLAQAIATVLKETS
jgi:negative regulator of flagellin synthesis FlgM